MGAPQQSPPRPTQSANTAGQARFKWRAKEVTLERRKSELRNSQLNRGAWWQQPFCRQRRGSATTRSIAAGSGSEARFL